MYDTMNYTLHSVNCNSIPVTKPTTNDIANSHHRSPRLLCCLLTIRARDQNRRCDWLPYACFPGQRRHQHQP